MFGHRDFLVNDTTKSCKYFGIITRKIRRVHFWIQHVNYQQSSASPIKVESKTPQLLPFKSEFRVTYKCTLRSLTQSQTWRLPEYASTFLSEYLCANKIGIIMEYFFIIVSPRNSSTKRLTSRSRLVALRVLNN